MAKVREAFEEVCYEELAQKFPRGWIHLMTAKPQDVAGVKNETAEVRRALEHPIGSERVSEIAKAGDRVVILVDDWTRPTPTARILPIVFDELHRAGVRDEDVSIVIAPGTRKRLMTPDELKRKLGDFSQRINIIQHDCDDKQQLSYLGMTSRGTPVWINKTVVDADIRIGIGFIAPVDLGGFTGGGKIILPGVAGRETINYNHSLFIPGGVRLGQIHGNYIREDMEEAASMARLNFTIDAVLNNRKQIIEVAAGDFIKAHREGVKIANKIFTVNVPKRADVVILNPEGFGVNLWEALSMPSTVADITKDGETIIVDAPCPYGIGGEGTNFIELLKQYKDTSPQALLHKIITHTLPPESVVTAWIVYSYLSIRGKAIIIFASPGLDKFREELKDVNIDCTSSVDEAIDKVAKKQKEAEVITVPYGQFIVLHGPEFFVGFP